jgi:Spy/CpxP family protein refolding chaperone
LRALELDGGQRDELRGLFFGLKRSARGLRQDDDWRRLVEVLAAPSFDRGKVEAASAEKAAAFDRLRAEFIAALEKAHAVLKPEQRARLADWFQVGFAPSAGPYR